MSTNKKAHIIGGGTVLHVRPHMAVASVAYGQTARRLAELCRQYSDKLDVQLHLTRMANFGQGDLETNDDVAALLDRLIGDPTTKIIMLNAALADYAGEIIGDGDIGKYGTRLQTRNQKEVFMRLTPTEKLINRVRREHKEIFAVAWKVTAGVSEDEMYIKGLHLVKGASCNLVFVNDVRTRLNMIVTPEEARYHVTKDREEALKGLVEMTYARSHLMFTRSTVVSGESVPWDSPEVPKTLRAIVDYCIRRGAYKPFRGATAGHFAVKLAPNVFLTSRRKEDFNNLSEVGLVKVVTDGPDFVIAYGSKPSVGGQSQRIVFEEHPDANCVVHFHCPIKAGSPVPTVSQREFECGSHECGRNTSRGLKRFGNLLAVYLDQHGPNIVFHHSINPQEVMAFIDANFDLSAKTGGYVELPEKPEVSEADAAQAAFI